MIFFLFLFQKIGLEENLCEISKPTFWGKKKENISKCCLLEVFHSMLGVKGFQVYFCHPTVSITITNKKKQQQTNKKQKNFNAFL